MSPLALLQLGERLAPLSEPLELHLDLGPDPDDGFARELRRAAEEIVAAADGRLRLSPASGGERASLRVGNVRYLAVPAGPELEPFLELLGHLADAASRPALTSAQARLLLLTAPTCPRCPAVVSVCTELAAFSSSLELTVVDALRFPVLAAGCRSVPTLIIDERRALVGPLTLEQLKDALAGRERPGALRTGLGSLVQAGRLADAARLLAEPEGPVAFAHLFTEAALPERVGLLLLAEQALDEDPCRLDAALPHLSRLPASADPSSRGDLADLLGRIGSPAARQLLQSLLTDQHPEVREAAREALSRRGEPN